VKVGMGVAIPILITTNKGYIMREYKVEDLDRLGWIKISFVGEENIYFKHMNVWCFCKVGR
jgi:hypothetical protein